MELIGDSFVGAWRESARSQELSRLIVHGPVPDGALLMRGGHQRTSDLRRAATLAHAKLGRFALSAYAGHEGEDALMQDVAVVNRVVRFTKAGRLRSLDFDVVYSGVPPHCSVFLPDAEQQTLERFASAFDEPVDNPFAIESEEKRES